MSTSPRNCGLPGAQDGNTPGVPILGTLVSSAVHLTGARMVLEEPARVRGKVPANQEVLDRLPRRGPCSATGNDHHHQSLRWPGSDCSMLCQRPAVWMVVQRVSDPPNLLPRQFRHDAGGRGVVRHDVVAQQPEANSVERDAADVEPTLQLFDERLRRRVAQAVAVEDGRVIAVRLKERRSLRDFRGSDKTYSARESSCNRRKQITQAASVSQASWTTAKRS